MLCFLLLWLCGFHAATAANDPVLFRQPVTSLADAKELHAVVARRARQIEREHGHYRPEVRSGMPSNQCTASWGEGSTPLRPVDFGADPSGKVDSTSAMQDAMAALLTSRDGAPRKTMASNITDLGGATLDLSGGTYLISAPLVIPPYFGNLQIVRGTLRASQTFPATRWLVEIGSSTGCNPKLPDGRNDVQGSCGQMINLNEMMFDASQVAAGGVRVQKTMGTTIGPSAFFTGFKQVGVRVDGGHEVMIQQSWFAECMWSDARGTVSGCEEDPLVPGGNISKSIGIQLNGADNFLTDVIVFEFTHIGVEINGAANLLQGVHTWNAAILSKQSSYFQRGGVGIAVNGPQNRLIGCYLDFSSLSVTDPSQLILESSFFLATSAVFISQQAKTLTSVNFRGNTYAGAGPSIVVDPAFTDGVNCAIVDEVNAGPATLKMTRASKTILHLDPSAPAAEFVADFGAELLLPRIEEVEYSFVAAGDGAVVPFVQHRAVVVNGTRVVVQMEKPVCGQVTVRVAQAVNGLAVIGGDSVSAVV